MKKSAKELSCSERPDHLSGLRSDRKWMQSLPFAIYNGEKIGEEIVAVLKL